MIHQLIIRNLFNNLISTEKLFFKACLYKKEAGINL